MKIVYNKIIPFPGYKCITLWPFVFSRYKMNDVDIRHEGIHLEQQKELLVLPFYIIYVTEWIIRLLIYRDQRKAYRSISFENEAYKYENDTDYHRKPFAMWREQR